MSETYEDTGYTPAGNQAFSSRKRRSELARDRELDKIMADLADTTGKYSLDNDPDSGILKEED